MKINIGNVPFVYPTPIALVGTMIDGKINYTLIGDVGIMGLQPPLVYVSLNTAHLSTEGVKKNKKFSINFPNTKLLSDADLCGVKSGKVFDKSNIFDSSFVDNIPVIDECPVSIICHVVEQVVIKQRHIFICEVDYTYVNELYVTFNHLQKPIIASLDQLDPILYGLDNNYYNIGKIIGKGYKAYLNKRTF